jgi:hypothetical protein
MSRRTLPQRRYSETFDLMFRNQTIAITVGRYANGDLGEIFINVGKSGTDIASVAHDAAVLLSLALQYGVPIEAIRHAVSRNGASGDAASIIGVDKTVEKRNRTGAGRA